MNSELKQILDLGQGFSVQVGGLATAVDTQLSVKDQTILGLQKDVSDMTITAFELMSKFKHLQNKVTIVGIQAMVPETLWYEARSAGAPKTGPHGTVLIKPGSPATADFHPVVLPGNQSDNCYNLQRLYSKLTGEQKTALEQATEFTISCDVALDPLVNVQAFELDYQPRKSSGVVINVGLQILGSASSWQVRLFDYVNKDWVPVGAKVTPKAGILTHVEVSAVCDDKVVQFISVGVDKITTPVTFSHPVSMSILNSPYLNAAYQLDATGNALPYKATVDNLTVIYN